jgi:Uma2 family endonuclease
MATVSKITTARQLLQSPDPGRCELIEGELRMMSPAGFEHGRVVNNIAWLLTTYVRAHHLGIVTGAETGYQLAHHPDTVLAPDVGFIAAERAPGELLPGYFDGPPDLAVEVLSPSDRARAVARKVTEWLDAGCQEVWVVNPTRRTVRIHHSGIPMIELREADEITGDELLPGFRLPVADVFGR